MKRLILIAATLLSLSSCGLYTKYERPDVSFTDSLYRRVSDADDTTSLATLKWEDLFTDPELQRWIKIGVDNNTDLRMIDGSEAYIVEEYAICVKKGNSELQKAMNDVLSTMTEADFNALMDEAIAVQPAI